MVFSRLRRSSKVEGICGLEIFPDGVALAHVISGMQQRPHLAFCEYREMEDPSQLSRSLTALVRERGLEGAACVAVLHPEEYSLRLLEAPEVERNELAEAAQWLVKDLLDFSVDEAVTDFFEIPDQVSRGRPNRIYVVVAHQSAVRNVIDVVRESGLDLRAIDITELALRNLTTLLRKDEEGLALMQLGRRRGLITVVKSNQLYLARALEAGFGRLSAEPEAFEDVADVRFEGDTERFDSLALEVHRSLDFYESELGQPPVANLVVAPLEQEIPDLLPFLEKNLTANVRALDLNELFACSEILPVPLQAQSLAAVGAALRMEPSS
jgi:MSHA biogenesis protein MshI